MLRPQASPKTRAAASTRAGRISRSEAAASLPRYLHGPLAFLIRLAPWD